MLVVLCISEISFLNTDIPVLKRGGRKRLIQKRNKDEFCTSRFRKRRTDGRKHTTVIGQMGL